MTGNRLFFDALNGLLGQSARHAANADALVAEASATPPEILIVVPDNTEDAQAVEALLPELDLPTILLLPPGADISSHPQTLQRPFRWSALQALLAKLSTRPQRWSWGFDPSRQRIFSSSREEFLTEKECALLQYLAKTAEAVRRDEIMAEVWGYDAETDTHTLETHLYRLRGKLSQVYGDKVRIEVIDGTLKLEISRASL